MRKYVVLLDFTDKHTDITYVKDSKYEATEERAAELIEKGFLEKPIKKEKPKDESIQVK
jgi:hypothetical protein